LHYENPFWVLLNPSSYFHHLTDSSQDHTDEIFDHSTSSCDVFTKQITIVDVMTSGKSLKACANLSPDSKVDSNSLSALKFDDENNGVIFDDSISPENLSFERGLATSKQNYPQDSNTKTQSGNTFSFTENGKSSFLQGYLTYPITQVFTTRTLPNLFLF